MANPTPSVSPFRRTPRPALRAGRSLPDPDRLLPEWRADMKRRNLSPATLKRRLGTVRRFETFVEPRALVHATADDVVDWLDTLELSPNSHRHYIGDIAEFFRWCQSRGILSDNPCDYVVRPKTPRYLPHPIGDDDLAFLVTIADHRMRAILLLGALAGLRAAEIADLSGRDVDLPGNLLWVRHGKGDKERVVPLHPDLKAALALLPRAGSGPVIARLDGGRYKPGTITAYVSEFMRGNGVPDSAHSLRHWFATWTYRSTRDIRLVGDLLGHANVSTTAVYAKVAPEAARPAVEALTIGTAS